MGIHIQSRGGRPYTVTEVDFSNLERADNLRLLGKSVDSVTRQKVRYLSDTGLSNKRIAFQMNLSEDQVEGILLLRKKTITKLALAHQERYGIRS